MGKRSGLVTLETSKTEAVKEFVQKARGTTSLEFSAMTKNFSTADFQDVCKTLGIEYKEYEGRIQLLSRVYFFINPNPDKQDDLSTQIALNEDSYLN